MTLLSTTKYTVDGRGRGDGDVVVVIAMAADVAARRPIRPDDSGAMPRLSLISHAPAERRDGR